MAHKQNETLNSARQFFSGLQDSTQSYIIMAVGIFLLLFAVGYFAFLRSLIGIFGCLLIAWGALRLNLLHYIMDFISSLKKRFKKS
jgi:hypothetical protein